MVGYAPPMKARTPRAPLSFRQKAFLLGFGLVIAVLCAEVATRIVHRFIPLYEDKTTYYVTHSDFHHWHEPNVDGVSSSHFGEFTDIRFRSNSLGMIGEEVPFEKPDGLRRIAMLGDSFVEGLTTEQHDSIVLQTEKKLNERSADRHEVLNFGCSSFSPSLEYFSLVTLGHRFRPDVVVVVFHATDVTNDWEYHQRAVYDSSGSVVRIDGSEAKSHLYRLAEGSAFLRAVVQRVRHAMATRRAVGGSDLMTTYDVMFREPYSEADLEAWALTRSYLDRIHAWAERANVPMLLIALPVEPQIEDIDPNSEIKLRFLADDGLIESSQMQDVLRGWAERSKCEYLDLLPVFRTAKRAHPEQLLFYPIDQHFTAAGNAVAAGAIADRLLEMQRADRSSESAGSTLAE